MLEEIRAALAREAVHRLNGTTRVVANPSPRHMIASVAKRVAMLLENEFDDDEVATIVKLLQEGGCDVTFVAPFAGRAYTGSKGAVLTSGMNAAEALTAGFDALIVPGGQAPDRLRMRPAVVDLIRDAVA